MLGTAKVSVLEKRLRGMGAKQGSYRPQAAGQCCPEYPLRLSASTPQFSWGSLTRDRTVSG